MYDDSNVICISVCMQAFSIEGRPREIISISTRLSIARAKWRPNSPNHVTRYIFIVLLHEHNATCMYMCIHIYTVGYKSRSLMSVATETNLLLAR